MMDKCKLKPTRKEENCFVLAFNLRVNAQNKKLMGHDS